MANILVVDDSPVTRAIIMEFLQILGHHVVGEAEDLSQTLAAYAAHHPGLVTLDLSMSRENGFTVLRALRAADPKAKVLIVSGNSQPKIYEQLLTEGAAGFVAKPIVIDALAAAVTKALAA